MKSPLLLLVSTLPFLQATNLNSEAYPKTRGQPWPMPREYVSETYALNVDASLSFISNLESCDVIKQAIARYRSYATDPNCARDENGQVYNLKKSLDQDLPILLSVNITVDGMCEKWPTSSSREDYTLSVDSVIARGIALINAPTIWGALRGLETFSQLVYDNGDGVLLINRTTIQDYPRFGYRGLMLDTSRHYLPLRAIFENLEAMSQNKLNVFHWHIVDDQSFPYVSKAFPDISKLGAFSAKHVYSPTDIAKVIEYARVRGIRVIPEFDSPGHTQSWGAGQPNLLTPCYTKGKSDGTFGPVNPTLNSTYDFFKTFFQEISQVFQDQYIHLGGDEVSFDCWKSNPDVMEFMKTHGMAQNFSLLEEYYEQNMVNIMTSLRKNFIVWQEVFDNKVQMDKNTVVHIWKTGYQNELAAVTKAGFNTILSSCWYLNKISYGIDWHQYYTCDPYNFNGTSAQKDLVVGGSACMWMEFADGMSMMTRTWPRASSVAERLWSDISVKDPNHAAPRLEEHRCRMMKRGLSVEPINGPSCCECDIYN